MRGETYLKKQFDYRVWVFFILMDLFFITFSYEEK